MRAIEMFDEVEGGHCLEHRNLDAASHPRPLALDDRRQYRDRADQPARLVGNDRREIGRSAELSAENVGAAGKALNDIVISRTAAIGTSRVESVKARIDEPGIAFEQDRAVADKPGELLRPNIVANEDRKSTRRQSRP